MGNKRYVFMNALKKIAFTLLGLLGLAALMCSVAASCVTNEALMHQGFLNHGNTAHLNLTGDYYDEAAKGIAAYMDGRADEIAHPVDASNPLFSENEMLHLADVRGIVNALKIIRWAGGLTAILGILVAWVLDRKQEKNTLMQSLWQGFAYAGMGLFAIGLAICIWGFVDFESLFWQFHLVSFTNDLWLMDPATDLMIALMPESFFVWYAGELLKALLPIFGIMLCLIISWLKVGRKEMKGAKDAK